MSSVNIFINSMMIGVFGISFGHIFIAVNFFWFGLIIWIFGAISTVIAIATGIKLMYHSVSERGQSDKELKE